MYISPIKKFCLFLFLQLLIALAFCTRSHAQFRTPNFDNQILLDLQDTRTPAQTGFFRFISNTNTYVDAGVPVGLFLGGAIGNNKAMRENAAYVFSSSAVSYGVTTLIKVIFKRPRPFLQNVRIKAVYEPTGYSFPSGHSSSSFTTATALSMAYPKWYVILPSYLWAGSVAYSRMYLGVHYPTDVGTGALLGAGTALSFSFMKK